MWRYLQSLEVIGVQTYAHPTRSPEYSKYVGRNILATFHDKFTIGSGLQFCSLLRIASVSDVWGSLPMTRKQFLELVRVDYSAHTSHDFKLR